MVSVGAVFSSLPLGCVVITCHRLWGRRKSYRVQYQVLINGQSYTLEAKSSSLLAFMPIGYRETLVLSLSVEWLFSICTEQDIQEKHVADRLSKLLNGQKCDELYA
ncbi:hypothetical protein OUZ56_029508 [Daphnia magna]|uniref:Uncharacterized protein n=1 Tax=Daphnia magna TaxID=35525 RepID=A0ABR0B718_9CRUS|nr:hypothetical protein OUZ56_029508 [Daphnia magna]